jgi:protein ImuA
VTKGVPGDGHPVSDIKAKAGMRCMVTQKLIDQLRDQIRGVETAGRMDDGIRVSSGCAAIDRLLPEGGYQRGTLIQWLTGGGQGADYLSLLVARQACQDGGALVVLDPLNQFYPPAAAAIGINLDNLIILRTENLVGSEQELHSDLLWSIDQALRCPAVAAVWGPLGRIDERWFRRFQLSAETSGCLGLFIQPIQAARQPSWAEVQWMVSHLRAPGGQTAATRVTRTVQLAENSAPDVVSRELAVSRLQDGTANGAQQLPFQSHWQQQVRLQLTRCRGTRTGKTVNLSINTITGNVQLARRDHEQHSRTSRNDSQAANRRGVQRSGETTGPPKDPLSVASQLAHPAADRQRA